MNLQLVIGFYLMCFAELIITAGGENVAPVPIEDFVKEELPVVSNCMLIGDKKKFLSMLIALKVVITTPVFHLFSMQ